MEPKVLLLYAPLQFFGHEIPRPDGSLGLLYLAGALEDAGITVDVVDAVLGPAGSPIEESFHNRIVQSSGLLQVGMSFEKIAQMAVGGRYNVVGIESNFTPQTKMVVETARIIKAADPSILVAIGGVNARSLVKYFLQLGCVDVVALTEAEKIFPRLVRQWCQSRNFDGIDGIAFMLNGQLVFVPPRPDSFSINLDELPLPRWGKLPQDKYARVASPHGDVTTMVGRGIFYAPIMTSRGCPFKCAYCHISLEKERPGDFGDIGSYRMKSVGRVLAEIQILKDLGAEKLYFEDDSLLAKKARVRAIFERVVGSGLEIANVNGVNLVHFLTRNKTTGELEPDADYFELLKAAGFEHIVFPVESGSQRILDKYATAKLNLKTTNLVKLVQVASKVGITSPLNMMIGFPDQTEAEIMESVDLAKRLIDAGAAYCAFFIPIPFPGSQLFHYAIAHGHLDPNFDPDIFSVYRVVMRNTTVPPERLVELREWAFRTVNPKEYVEARIKASTASTISLT